MGNTQAFKRLRRGAYRLAGWQLVVTALAAVAAGLFGGRSWLISAFVGGCIGIVAGLYQALRMFRTDASQAIKIMFTVALFVTAIKILRVEFVPTLIGYTATFFVYWAFLRTGFPGTGITKSLERTSD